MKELEWAVGGGERGWMVLIARGVKLFLVCEIWCRSLYTERERMRMSQNTIDLKLIFSKFFTLDFPMRGLRGIVVDESYSLLTRVAGGCLSVQGKKTWKL